MDFKNRLSLVIFKRTIAKYEKGQGNLNGVGAARRGSNGRGKRILSSASGTAEPRLVYLSLSVQGELSLYFM